MPSDSIQRILDRLEGVKSQGHGWTARCPAHEDHRNSLSISEGENGKVLIRCFAGCVVESVVEAIGLQIPDLFPTAQSLPDKGTCEVGHIKVQDLATDKQLPVDLLKSLGLEDRSDGVLIPYSNPDGSRASRNRLRTALRAGDGSIWMFGKGKPVAYGLDRLGAVREAGYLILVEGESDCWTLWHHGFPAIGIPGAGMTKVLRVDNLENIPRILVCQEPGRGGETFVAGVAKQLRNLKWKGDLFVFSLTGCKDPNELHRVDPERFTPTFQSALDGAERLEFTNPASDADVGASIEIDRVVTSSGLDKLTKNSTPRQIDESLREFVARLEGSDDLLRAVARVTAIKQLQRIKSGAPAKLVDAAFKTLRESTDHRDLPGHHGFLSDPEPHQEPVDGTKLLDDLVRTFEKFIVLVDGAAVALALWTIHTYAIAASYISPIIALLSPEKRCGKTTVLIVLGALVRKSLPASNITSAALFRSIEHYTPTLLIDEADSFLAKSDELRGVLNSGHTRANAVVIRTVGDNHEPKVFSTWGPKAIALIGKLPSTLEDRSVVIPMRRQAPGEKAERVRQEHLGTELGELRAQIARWVADHEDDLEGIDPDVPHELHDRAQDNWRPLLGIADAAGGDWPERARRAALDLNRSDREGDSTPGVQLLSDLRDLFEGRGVDRMSSEQIVAVLTKMEDRPWPEWRRGQPLTQSGLARLLKRYDIRPRTIRMGSDTAKGYLLSDFTDAFRRYLPSEPSHRNKREISSDSADSEPSQDPACYGSENEEKGRHDGLVTAVTPGTGETDAEDAQNDPEEEFEI